MAATHDSVQSPPGIVLDIPVPDIRPQTNHYETRAERTNQDAGGQRGASVPSAQGETASHKNAQQATDDERERRGREHPFARWNNACAPNGPLPRLPLTRHPRPLSLSPSPRPPPCPLLPGQQTPPPRCCRHRGRRRLPPSTHHRETSPPATVRTGLLRLSGRQQGAGPGPLPVTTRAGTRTDRSTPSPAARSS